MEIIFKKSKKKFNANYDYSEYASESKCLKAVEQNGYALKYVDIRAEFIQIV